jgi:precorrin-6x reductase
VFSTLGASAAEALTRVDGFAERVWLRVLPVAESITSCAALGYPAAHIIGMRGPFSRELNAAMFRHAGAAILVTKESGQAGGAAAKLGAARDCALAVAILDRPAEAPGVTLADARRLIAELLPGAGAHQAANGGAA